jgi:hypothetical protein
VTVHSSSGGGHAARFAGLDGLKLCTIRTRRKSQFEVDLAVIRRSRKETNGISTAKTVTGT